jgi:hypothetical protein
VLAVAQRLDQRLRLHRRAVLRARHVERVDALGDRRLVRVHLEVEPVLSTKLVAVCQQLAEVPRRVDVQQRERRLRRVERLARDVQHARRVLAAGEQQHRPFELRDDLAQDMDALRLELAQVRQRHLRASTISRTAAAQPHDRVTPAPPWP